MSLGKEYGTNPPNDAPREIMPLTLICKRIESDDRIWMTCHFTYRVFSGAPKNLKTKEIGPEFPWFRLGGTVSSPRFVPNGSNE